ncbi:MAG: PilN domain-containing protein [Nitrospinaceae bacterium]
MIRINLYDYQRIAQEVAIQKRVVSVALIILVSLLGSGVLFMVDQFRIDTLKEETAELQTQLASLEGQFKSVKKLQARQAKLTGIIDEIQRLRGEQVPVAGLLEEISDNLPQGLWLETIEKQDEGMLKGARVPILFVDKEDAKKGAKKGKGSQHQFIRISGKARSDRSVVRFMERLEGLAYLDHVILHRSRLKWINFESVRDFEIYGHLTGSGPKPGSKKKKT